MSDVKPIAVKPRLYAVYFQNLLEIARDMGYNLLVNGSMNRDLDLVAVPWSDKPKPEDELIQAFDVYLNGYCRENPKSYLFSVLPGGRNSYVINLHRRDEDGRIDHEYYLDISITPLVDNDKSINKKYKVVTLCGSTKFKEEFHRAQKNLTFFGNIVLSLGVFGHSGDDEAWVDGVKELLDDMHKVRIDMADEIFVINKDGYIGSGTQLEIEYAEKHGKRVTYMEPRVIDI